VIRECNSAGVSWRTAPGSKRSSNLQNVPMLMYG